MKRTDHDSRHLLSITLDELAQILARSDKRFAKGVSALKSIDIDKILVINLSSIAERINLTIGSRKSKEYEVRGDWTKAWSDIGINKFSDAAKWTLLENLEAWEYETLSDIYLAPRNIDYHLTPKDDIHWIRDLGILPRIHERCKKVQNNGDRSSLFPPISASVDKRIGEIAITLRDDYRAVLPNSLNDILLNGYRSTNHLITAPGPGIHPNQIGAHNFIKVSLSSEAHTYMIMTIARLILEKGWDIGAGVVYESLTRIADRGDYHTNNLFMALAPLIRLPGDIDISKVIRSINSIDLEEEAANFMTLHQKVIVGAREDLPPEWITDDMLNNYLIPSQDDIDTVLDLVNRTIDDINDAASDLLPDGIDADVIEETRWQHITESYLRDPLKDHISGKIEGW